MRKGLESTGIKMLVGIAVAALVTLIAINVVAGPGKSAGGFLENLIGGIPDADVSDGEGSGSGDGGGGDGPPDETTTTTVTTDYDTLDPDAAFTVEGGTITLDAAQSAGDDTVLWDTAVPEGWKTVKVTFNVQDRGHLRFEARDGGGNTKTYVNLDGNGEEHLWFNSQGSGSETYGDTGADYQTGVDYMLTVRQPSSGNIEWVLASGGEEAWSGTSDAPSFVSFAVTSGADWTEPVVTIKAVEVTSG